MAGLAEESVWLLVELFSVRVCPEVAMIRVVFLHHFFPSRVQGQPDLMGLSLMMCTAAL